MGLRRVAARSSAVTSTHRSFTEILKNQPDPRSDLTSALLALRTIFNHAIHSTDGGEYLSLSEAAADLEAFVYSHASSDEMREHLDRDRRIEDGNF